MEKNNFLYNNERIPLEYRKSKEKAKNLLKYIEQNNIQFNNEYIYSLASWVGMDFDNFKYLETFSEIKSIDILENEDTYDLEIDEDHTYTANGIVCHNTHNLPEDTTLETVKKIYEFAWENGVKGVTIYREGSRSGVLLSNESDKEEEFPETKSPKRPKELPCDYYIAKAKGKEYAVIVGKLKDKPYEIFAFENPPRKSHTTGKIVKIKKGQFKFINGEFEIENLQLAADKVEERALTLLASMVLRHGVPISRVNKTIQKIDENIVSFSSVVRRTLSRYIKEEPSGEECPYCGDKMIMQDGCMRCVNEECGYEKCS